MAFEQRWMAIGEDGRHVTLGRHSEPTDDELAAATKALEAQNVAAWLVVVEGDYWGRRKLDMVMVRPLLEREGRTWPDAQAAFLERRRSATAPADPAVSDPVSDAVMGRKR